MDFLTRILALALIAGSAFAQELDRVAVIVNDGVVLESDIQQKISEFKKNATLNGQKNPTEEVIREDILDQLIVSELQLQIADKVGIKISDEELNVTVKRLAQQNNLDIEAFIKVVEERTAGPRVAWVGYQGSTSFQSARGSAFTARRCGGCRRRAWMVMRHPPLS